MDSEVISDCLKDKIGGRLVKAVVFTTFNFEPEFFEQDVIPLLLDQENAYSTDERVKEVLVREALRKSELLIEVFYDLPLFRQDGNNSPQMEYLCHGVNLGNKAFHSKNIFILLYDEKWDIDFLLVGAGSNNLTKAGWWDNIECQHWEEVWSGHVQSLFLKRLKEDIAWLSDRQGVVPSNQKSALREISKFLVTCRGSNNASPVAFYGPSHIESHGGVLNFLKQQKGTLGKYSNWTLEIISPFFAEDVNNKEHEAFYKLGVNEIRILLPMDDEGNACCDPKYYAHINADEYISWAKWRSKYIKTLGVSCEPFRRLHAKIYHFYNGLQSWVFVGSVNFTHKALKENVESGFLVKLEHIDPLLEELKENEGVDKFAPASKTEAETDLRDSISGLPELHLSYDWIEKQLSGRTTKQNAYEIQIKSPEGELITENWIVTAATSIYVGKTSNLESLLKNGSLITVTGKSSKSKESFPEHTVLLQQTGWTHKPIELAKLSPSQILAIFAGMSQERRQLLLANAQIQKLVLSGYAGEMSSILDEENDNQFFCEYAEIFHAFRKLRDQLYSALDNKQLSQVDYYLTGTGMDSLPTLLKCVDENTENSVNGVTAYLLLLSARELYSNKLFRGRPNVKDCLTNVKKNIIALKKSGRIRLERENEQMRQQFFGWYEEQFSKEYIQQTIEVEST